MPLPEEWHGLWWFAEAPENKVPGWMRIDPKGKLTLTLSGALGGSDVLTTTESQRPARILGQLETLPLVTLEGCLRVQVAAALVMPRETWLVGEAVIGAQFSAEEPWTFYGAAFSIPGLTRWVTPTGVEQGIITEPDTPTRLTLAASADERPLWRWGLQVVQAARAISTAHSGEFTSTISAEYRASIHGIQRMTKDALFEQVVAPLQVMLALATGEFTAATSAKAYIEPFKSDGSNESFDWRWQPHDIELKSENVRYAFYYAHIQALTPTIWDDWIAFWKVRDSVRDLYLAAIRKLHYTELSFLLIAQALESLHRSLASPTLMPSAEWRQLKATLRSAMEQAKAPDGLIAKLGYLNQPTLRTRLGDLGSHLEPLLAALAGGDPVAFFKRVANTRNYYTHWEGDEGVFKQGAETAYATERLLAMLELFLLKQLGFSLESAACQEIVRRRISWLPPT